MTDMKQNQEAMNAQELEKVEGGFVTLGKLPINFPGKLPLVLGKRNDEGIHYRFPLISKVTTISPIVW